MSKAIRTAIHAYITAHNGSSSYPEIIDGISPGLSLEEGSIGIIGALLEMVNAGTLEVRAYFARTQKGAEPRYQLQMAPCLPAFDVCRDGITLRDLVHASGTDEKSASILLHRLWWDGLLEREYRYAIPSSLPSAPQGLAQNDDTTSPLSEA